MCPGAAASTPRSRGCSDAKRISARRWVLAAAAGPPSLVAVRAVFLSHVSHGSGLSRQAARAYNTLRLRNKSNRLSSPSRAFSPAPFQLRATSRISAFIYNDRHRLRLLLSIALASIAPTSLADGHRATPVAAEAPMLPASRVSL